MQLFEAGLAEHKRREAEVSLFASGVTKTKENCKQQTRELLAEFDRQHREVSCEGCNVLKSHVLGYAYGFSCRV